MGDGITERMGDRRAVAASFSARARSVVLDAALWVSQLALAVLFGLAGILEMSWPIPDLAEMLTWPGEIPPALVRFIGVSEFAGGIGVLMPSLLRVRPFLAPLAACGLALVMGLALAYNTSLGRWQPINVVPGSVAAFVAWGRFRWRPISARGLSTRGRA